MLRAVPGQRGYMEGGRRLSRSTCTRGYVTQRNAYRVPNHGCFVWGPGHHIGGTGGGRGVAGGAVDTQAGRQGLPQGGGRFFGAPMATCKRRSARTVVTKLRAGLPSPKFPYVELTTLRHSPRPYNSFPNTPPSRPPALRHYPPRPARPGTPPPGTPYAPHAPEGLPYQNREEKKKHTLDVMKNGYRQRYNPSSPSTFPSASL